MKRYSGFTLIETMIVIAIIGIMIAIAVLACSELPAAGSSPQVTPADEAKNFVTNLYSFTDVRAICTDSDSDGDGYVSCTTTGVDANQQRHTVPLLCSRGSFGMTSGCKLSVGAVQ